MLRDRIWRHFDWKLMVVVLALTAIGLIYIHSATFGGKYTLAYNRQLMWLAVSLLAMVVLLLPDYHLLSEYSTVLYLLLLGVLLGVLIFGKTVHGSTSWFHLGSYSAQPSEIAKIAAILTLARYFSNAGSAKTLSLQELGFGLLLVGVPMILILWQGDLGTTVTLVPVFVAMAFVCGVKRKVVIASALVVILVLPLMWGLLKDYQRDRILNFVNPEKVPLTVGYQSLQSKIAIGSGKLFGKGIRQGSQSQLGFIPFRHTDFIFAVISEEAGFAGALVVLLLYVILFFRIFEGAATARDRLGILICVGVLALLFFHVVMNIGMVVGLLPIAGLPLPLLSYGGSSLLSTFLALGLVLNVKLRRYAN
jgi:rod shape determining protein RodA